MGADRHTRVPKVMQSFDIQQEDWSAALDPDGPQEIALASLPR